MTYEYSVTESGSKYAMKSWLRRASYGVAIIVWLGGCADGSSMPAPLSVEAALGKQIFNQCRACHALEPATGHLVGPNLHAVVGSRAARHADYEYSASLRSASIVWTSDTLALFLTRPSDYVPGTKMTFGGLLRAEDRRAVIAYLTEAGGP